ncbi:hypothetical protein ABW21_db0205163 [Orbilia brochopaga]|nr:hypothetical protein ABW21_db0205163 [Drechslerella brochopaga]
MRAGGLYQAVVRRERIIGVEVGAGNVGDPKQWHGYPTAVIYHAFNILRWYSSDWMTDEVAGQLHRLMRLYTRTNPWELNGAVTGAAESGNDGGNGEQVRDSAGAVDEDEADDGEDEIDDTLIGEQIKMEWAWGPESTAAMKMRLFAGSGYDI